MNFRSATGELVHICYDARDQSDGTVKGEVRRIHGFLATQCFK
ncbi:hypothetical protein Plhal304r1_c063g0150471 [Plasmopara halstedii]